MIDNATDFFLPADLVARALDSLAEQCHEEIDRLSRQPEQGSPSVKEELRYRLREWGALIKASFEWGRGVRAVPTPRGGWLVPSRTTGGVVYEVSKANGFWQCGPNCKAVGAHWHTMLTLGIEHAIELADSEDDGPECQEPNPKGIGLVVTPRMPSEDDNEAGLLAKS